MIVIGRYSTRIVFVTLLLLVMQTQQVSAEIGDTLLVTSDGSRLRSQPTTKQGSIIKKLRRGEVLTELQRKGKWVSVRQANKKTSGWIYYRNVKPVVQDTEGLRVSKKTEKKADLNKRAWVTSLAEMGYKNGVLFEGTAANHARKLYFKVPQDIPLKSGLLRIHYTSSSLLNNYSNMRIFIDGLPRKIVRLGGESGSGWLEIKINPADVAKRYLEVVIKSAILISKNRCFDERVSGAYLQVLPDSTLSWQLDGKTTTIRTYWQLLPERVTISLPQGELEPDLLRNTLSLVHLLAGSGREVNFTRMPKMGHIVVAPRKQVTDWMHGEYNNLPADNINKVAVDSNIALLNLPDRQLLAIWGKHDKHSLGFLSDDWRDLAAGVGYQVYPELGSEQLTDDGYALQLSGLGMDTGAVDMGRQASWSAIINPSQLPPGHRLDKVRIQLITAPSETDNPVMFYGYLNGVLIKVVRLKNSGESQEVVLQLPEKQMERSNNLHFIVQRDVAEQTVNCVSKAALYPVQIQPDSAVETVLDDTSPERFADMPVYLASGYDTYLPRSYLKQPERILPYLASMMIDMDMPLQVERLHFYNKDEKISPKAPFLLIGQAQTSFDKQGVHFDKGRIDVVNRTGNVLLSVDALPRISIAQVVSSGDVHGLWLLPPASGYLARIRDMSLSKDDIAFADQKGIIMTLDSSQPGLSRVEYPDSIGWFDLLGEYRFWYFAIGWILLTSLIIYLYRLSRSHRKN